MKRVLSILALICLCCIGAKADEAFRLHRYDTFKVTPINENSIVFVGNSITNMHPWVEAFGNDPRVVNRGNSGGTSAEILREARSYCVGHPAKIFLMIGINDQPNSGNQATIVSNIENTIKIIQTESPSTKIYVQSILPSGWFSNPTNIANCNTAIQAMLANYPAVTYVDVYSQLLGKLDTDNSGVYSFDKLHTTAAGYAIWTNYIKEQVGLTPVYPSEAETKARQVNGGNGGSWGARATYFSMFPIASDDVLFFGDEMVHGAEWQELLGNIHVKNRGTSWGYEGTNGWMNYTKNDVKATFATVTGVTKQEPKQVLLYTGTGEANGSGNMTTIFNYYKGIVEDIRGYAPHAKISLVSLMPTKIFDNSRVKTFNQKMKEYAEATDNVEYIDIYSTLASNDVAKSEYFPVNNYLYGDGYVAVANVLARYIDGCTPVTAEQAAAYRKQVKGVTPDEDFFEEGWYQIQIGEGTGYNNNHKSYKGKYLYANPHTVNGYNWAIGLTDNADDRKTYVYITGEHDKWHIEFNHGTSDAYYVSYNCLKSATASNLSFIPNDDKSEWKIWGDNKHRWMGWDLSGPSVGSTSTSGNSAFDNCYFVFKKVVPSTTIDVTYTFNLDGKKIGEKVIAEVKGEAPTVASALPSYAKIVSGLPATVAEAAYTLETAHQGLPFELGDEHHYYINEWGIATRHYLLYANADNNAVKELKQNQANVDPSAIPDSRKLEFIWVMGGDWFNGFTFKNTLGYYIAAPSATPTDGAATVATLTESALCHFDPFVQASTGVFSYRPHGGSNCLAHTSDGSLNLSFYGSYSGDNLKATTYYFLDANEDYERLTSTITDLHHALDVPAAATSQTYDLFGRKVVNAQSGLYIKDGKKIIR